MLKSGKITENDALMDKLIKEDDGLTTTSIIECPVEEGSHKINLYITKPKSLKGSNEPCFIFNHGGGAVLFSAKSYHDTGLGKKFAVTLNCVVILVDYRKCPEVKHP